MVAEILQSIQTQKHLTMLSLISACGLRRGELLNLKPLQIDSKRHLLIILNGKGMKDRVVPTSDKVITMLRNYYGLYKPAKLLFEGQNAGEQYSESSLQEDLKIAIKKQLSKILLPLILLGFFLLKILITKDLFALNNPIQIMYFCKIHQKID